MPRPRFKHTDLCKLVEPEPDPQEEWSQLYREWKQAELDDLWCDIKRLEAARLRRLKQRKEQVESTLGIRLNVRVPRKLVDPPTRVFRILENN